MNQEIKNYIKSVIEEIGNSTISDYNLDSFDDFEGFDLINFHILNRHILENGQTDLFIGIPEEDYRENFFESIFYGIVIVKLFQNYCSYQATTPQLVANDIIFFNNKIYKYLGGDLKTMYLEKKFPAKNERNSVFPAPRAIYTKLDQSFDFQKRKTVEYLEGYSNFLKTTFMNPKFPLLTTFIHKTLVISDKKLIKVNENIPFRYHSRSGEEKHNLPIDNLIEICNSFTVAKNLIQEGKITNSFDEVIIIGDAKYRDEIFADIQDSKWQGHFKSIILIGTNKPETVHQFREWNWTKREIIIAHNQEPNGPEPYLVNNGHLVSAVGAFHNYVVNINQTFNADISYLLRFVNFFFRQVIVGSEGLLACENYLQRVKNHLEEKEFEGLLLPAVNYNQSHKQEIISNILDHFFNIEQLLLTKNMKWEKICDLARDMKVFLLVDKRQAEPLKGFLQANDIRNIKLVTNKKVGRITLLDDFIKDPDSNTPDKTLIVSYLSDPQIYNQLMEVKGSVQVLCYEHLDSQILENIKTKEENALAKHISHPDRNYFVTTKFQIEEQKTNQSPFFKNVFEFKEPGRTRRGFNTDGEPSNEGVWYQLEFEDGSQDIMMASKTVMWIVDGQQTEITVEECVPGAEIKYYKNTNREDFQEMLKTEVSKNLISEIELYSTVWKNALKTLLLQFKSISRLYREVMNGIELVSETHFEKYFDKNCATVFPSDKLLQAIFDCFNRHKYSECLYVQNFNHILKAASLHRSVSIKFGHYLSNLFSGDLATDIDGVISEANSLPEDLKVKILSFIKVGTVKSKSILNNKDARIPIQSELNF